MRATNLQSLKNRIRWRPSGDQNGMKGFDSLDAAAAQELVGRPVAVRARLRRAVISFRLPVFGFPFRPCRLGSFLGAAGSKRSDRL